MAISALFAIEADVKQFFSTAETNAGKFAAEFTKLFKASPSALQMIENFTSEAAAVIIPAVTLADPAVEPEVAAALAIVQTALAGIQAAAVAANSGTSLLVSLQNFADSVPQLLTSVAIKNPALQAAVTRIVNLVVGEAKVLIPAVTAWAEQIKATAPATQPA